MSIPASRIAKVNPGVVNPGGNPLALNGVFFTENTQMPAGTTLSFPSAAAVAAFFGLSSAEAALAVIYFGGYTGCTLTPGAMIFAPFNNALRAAYLQSGNLAALGLAGLNALAAGTLTITINGVAETSSSINLAGAASFSAAAALIQAAFTGTVPLVTWNAAVNAFVFTSPTTGLASTITFATTDALATGLALTAATGAFLSQGAAVDTPASALANLYASTQNFATVVTMFEPAIAVKEAFAQWQYFQNNQFGYLAWDTDAQAIVSGATEPFGVIAKAAGYNGVACISGNAADIPTTGPVTTLGAAALNAAAFVAGAIASIDFSQENGRITLAGRSQSGLTPTCTDDTAAQNLLANGYSFYGAYATANQSFTFFYNGNMPGEFLWLDTFINQIWLNSQMELALITGFTQVTSIPYDAAGYSLTRAFLMDPITAALDFGAIRTGVTLSAAEIAEVNQAAGNPNVATQISNIGYYLQILDPGAQARAARQTPIINFWYADGGAVQSFTVASIDVL